MPHQSRNKLLNRVGASSVYRKGVGCPCRPAGTAGFPPGRFTDFSYVCHLFSPDICVTALRSRRYRHELIDAEAGVYRYDHLIVLHTAHMPAVLLEAGSIINRQEELELATPERRLMVAEAVTAAVEGFCESREQAVTGQLPSKPASVPITKVRRGIRPAPISHPKHIRSAKT